MAALALASLQPAAAAPPLRVGLIAPLSGGSADFGTSVKHGATLAVEEINAAGGYLGRKIELVVRDDQGTPDVGRQAAIDLVQKEKVAFTIGYCNTGVALKSLEVFETAQHLLMVPCSQGTAVTRKTPPAKSFVFRVAPVDHMNAAVLVREIVDRAGFKRVAVLADRTGYGDGGVADVGAELDKRGLKPVYVGRYALGVASLRDELQAARAAGAEAVVNYTVGPEQAVAVRDRAAMGWRVPYYAPWPLSFGGVLKKAGAPALEGTMMTQSIIHDISHERRSSFLARYYKHSNDKPIGSLMAAAQAYDATYLMLWALIQTRGDSSGPALKAALENLNERYRGVVTTYDKPFSADDHDAFTANMIWLGVWRDGEIGFVHAEDARLSSVIRRKQDPR